jgi:homoserine dehydrogenase
LIAALGGLEPAYRITLAALAAGRGVITANKELIASRWDKLAPHLMGESPRLRCSAAVGGAVPMMELVQRLVASGQTIESFRGVVNGTCNFVLDAIVDGRSFDDAVRLAQERGFAEPDPSADIDGTDAARKIEILSRLAFGCAPLHTDVVGLRHAEMTSSSTERRVCRLVARAERHGGARVRPEWLADSDYLAHARGAENRLEVTTSDGTVHCVSGLGAGRYPTATSILADLIETSLERTPQRS